ncbi:MAG: hypothetical protein ACYC61_11175, partial [Isosphaeraceae bacterium]
MSQDSERLLESDRLEEVLDEPAPPQPVVVVEYRHRKRPWIPVLVVALLAVLGSFYELHRREVERLRLRAMAAQDELRSLKEQSLAGKLGSPGTASPAGPSVATTPAPAAVASSGHSQADANRGPSPAPISSSSLAPTSAGPDQSGPVTVGKSAIAPAADGPVARVEPATGAEPAAAVGAIAASTVPDPPRRGIVIEPATSLPGPEDGAAVAAGSGNAAEDAGGDGAIAVADRGEVPAPTPAPAVLEARPGALDDRPLPSREETEREIREEARRKQAESQDRATRQHEEVRDIRDEERQRFREELRLILEIQGNDAGQQIADLSDRSGRDDDPVLHAMALEVIGSRGTSQKFKVQRMRAIGVPEPVILDYLANTLNKNLGARNGPRSRDDVWVQAGRLLLRYDWKPPDTPAPASKPAAAAPAGRTA